MGQNDSRIVGFKIRDNRQHPGSMEQEHPEGEVKMSGRGYTAHDVG